MRHPRDLSGHLPLSRLNSFVMEPISTEAFKPGRQGRIGYLLDGRSGGRRTRCDVHICRNGQVAEPAPRYNSSQPNVTYGSTSVQWSGPSLYDYALGCNLGDRTAGELSGTAIRENAKKVRNESWAGCSTVSDVDCPAAEAGQPL